MSLLGASRFWITTTLIVAVGVCLSPGPARAQEPYDYYDDFNEDFAETTSFRHSIFWPQGAFPPPEPYLYYSGTAEDERELGFGGRHAQRASVGYRFPDNPSQSVGAATGILTVDVRYPDDAGGTWTGSGYLGYQVSADGVEWSDEEELKPGIGRKISIGSVRGTCHVVFFGTNVLIDNLSVRLTPDPVTIYVPGDYVTIQEAIDESADGDIIQVDRGTYGGNINFRGKAITVRSADGPDLTKIDCAGLRGFSFRRGEGADSVLRGFTITEGRAPGSAIPSEADDWIPSSSYSVGGGIFCEFSSPTIIDCVIEGCEAELGAGIGIVGGSPAIFDCVIERCRAGGPESGQSRGFGAGIGLIRGAEARIFNCVIKNNVAYSDSLGAGLYCRQSVATLVNCDISYNSASVTVKGGGIYCGGAGASIVLDKCLISNNTAEVGGGVFTEGFDLARLTNCTVASNTLSGPAGSFAGGIHSVSGDIVINNSIVWHNEGAAISLTNWVAQNPVFFSNVEGNFPGQGNMDIDPLFVSADTGDYHLKSVTGRYDSRFHRWVDDPEHSPCIDAGDPHDEIGAEPVPNMGRINMGAYGGTTEASKSYGPLIFHVDVANGKDSNSGLSRNDAFRTIGRALDTDPEVFAALDGDTILVWPGVYRESITFSARALTLQSAGDAAVITPPNLSTNSGFAFSFYNAESPRMVVRNFVIADCEQAAIYCQSASPTLVNLTVVGNRIGCQGVGGSNPTITNCIFWNNEEEDLQFVHASFSCVQELQGLDAENGNISQDPLFANPAKGDYHLRSRYGRYSAGSWVNDTLTSPCIDTGNPADFVGRERAPHGSIINMGAYGGTPSASLSRGY